MSNLPIKKNEIHPINTYRPPSAASAYKLIKWKPYYDMIVSGHILGRSNKELAAEYDYTEVHIGNILRSDNAQKLIKEASDRIRGLAITKSSAGTEIDSEIRQKARERILDFVNDDDIAHKSPFAFIDRVKSLANLEVPREPSSPVQVNIQNNQNVTNVREESLKRIAAALEISANG